MGVQRRQHAGDRGLDHLPVRRRFHVIGPDALENVAEKVQQPIGIGIVFLCLGGLGRKDQKSDSARRQ